MNILLELQRRQRSQPERWRQELPVRFAESRVVADWCERGANEVRTVFDAKSPTAEIVFSKDGRWMASGHNNRTIYIFSTFPQLSKICTLDARAQHTRTPWRLAFDPSDSHILFSGCLGGVVCKWSIRSGEVLSRWDSSTAMPITSLVFCPSSPELLFVSCTCRLYQLRTRSLERVWVAVTGSPDIKVRLLIHHPVEDTLLTAITSHPEPPPMFVHLNSLRHSFGTYRVQMYPSSSGPPDLTNKEARCLSNMAHIHSSSAVALTSTFVLLLYSVVKENFGAHLQTIDLPIGDRSCGMRLDVSHLSHFGRHLVLALGKHKLVVYHKADIDDSESDKDMLKVHVIRIYQQQKYANTLRWIPFCTGNGVIIGTESGSIQRIYRV